MQIAKGKIQWRALTSVLITTCFFMLLLSGAMLFVAPPGRIANWTQWTLLGLTKNQWTALHIWFSAVFLIAAVVHVIFNWRPLLGYFKDKATQSLGWRWEWALALVFTAAVFLGTLKNLPPFTALLNFNEEIKASWEKPADRAPIPHAELLTVAELAEKAGVELTAARARLQAAGIKGVADQMMVGKLAELNQTSGQRLYQLILGAPRTSEAKSAGGGPGRKTLAEYCAEQGLAVEEVLARLKSKGLKADEKATLRDMAINNGLSRPAELIEIIQGR